ncbi:hyphally regulated cell wall protein 3-like [Vanessa cardui]|uniref:hyphally regulated cell wall protein 3-like n=1 Tax=Vanessa cardui TaxID=171605 RepID=UPI001F12DFC7|nr:hyphally regulated cell wall protein 3-like [Vanessa cardui]
MAAKFVVALTCFALCHSSPIILNGYLYRDGRHFATGQGYTNNYGGRATGSATIEGSAINAYGSASTDGQNFLNRNIGYGEAYPGQAIAKAEIYDTPQVPVYGSAKAEAQNMPTYYAIPAPATIMSYEQNFEVPTEIRYTMPANGGVSAQSSAVLNGNSESSITSARTDGTGAAESSAKTQGIGSYVITASNAKTAGSSGSAYSDANNANGLTNIMTKTDGFGSALSKSQNGLGLTSAESQSNGGSATSSAKNTIDAIIASANTQGYGTASSNIDTRNIQNVHQKGIHWRFGTAFDAPSGQAHATSQSHGGSAKSTAQTNGYGTIQSTADTQGYGSADANANMNGLGYVHSVANNNGLGYGSAKSTANTNGYGSANSVANTNGLGVAKSSANTQGAGYGNADARADINSAGTITSAANTNGYGKATSTANTDMGYGALRYDGLYGGSRTIANAQTSGQGTASSSARTQGINAAYRVVNTSANSFGQGIAQANASA